MTLMAKKQKGLLEKAQWAEKIVEESGLDEKYRPALFQVLLTSETAPMPAEKPGHHRSVQPAKTKPALRITAPSALGQLYQARFFAQGRSVQEVTSELGRAGYHFGYETTVKALQRAVYLRGEGEVRSRRYYQKFPPG